MRSLLRPALVATAAAVAVIGASVALTNRNAQRRPPALPAPEVTAADDAPRAVLLVPPTGPVDAPAPTVAGARSAALAYLALSERVVGMDVDAAAAAQRDAA